MLSFYHQPYSASRYPVLARNGMVCTGNNLASSAGLQILREGGNAVDAAIATAAALTKDTALRKTCLFTCASSISVFDPCAGAKGGSAAGGGWISNCAGQIPSSSPPKPQPFTRKTGIDLLPSSIAATLAILHNQYTILVKKINIAKGKKIVSV